MFSSFEYAAFSLIVDINISKCHAQTLSLVNFNAIKSKRDLAVIRVHNS